MDDTRRPDPETLLRRVMQEEQSACRGRLKLFLGYASRVGKTTRMLDEVRRRHERGQNIVVGWVRRSPEIVPLLEGLELVPPRDVGDDRLEMDLDAILRRQPEICLVDELAHDNSPGSRFPTRWQDVEALMAAGITVISAVNVQFLEDLQPLVQELLGPRSRPTVPDRWVREADEVVLVDADEAEVLQRWTCRSDAPPRPTREILSRLREMALLLAADTADDRVEEYRSAHNIEMVWATQERILVCVTAHARGPALVERGRRAAARLHGELFVLYVTPDAEWSNMSVEQRTRVQETLALARTWQACVEVIESRNPAAAILHFARRHNTTQIFLGHGGSPHWPLLFSRSTVGRVIRGAGGMNVHVASDRPAAVTACHRVLTGAPAHLILTPRQRPGRLRIYLGYAAGVGKTFQMLDDANRLLAHGRDVVVGFFEPHERAETVARLGRLPIVPRCRVEYRDHAFEEMNLPAVLERHPEYCLVDELAHTNVPGLGHEKRWQDVLSLLDAGIHVLSTVNVQHLESLNDAVCQITGVRVRETVPDWVLDQAEEVILVDVSTRALLNRLRRGVVYPAEKARQALENFFREGNLASLRELSYRQAADTVEFARHPTGCAGSDVAEAVMVCISVHPEAGTVIRRGKRVADRLDAACWGVHVARDRDWAGLDDEQKQRLRHHLDLAHTLNVRAEILYGRPVARQLVSFAHERGVTQIFLGRSVHTGWREWLRENIIAGVVRGAPDLDIHVVADG